MTIELTPANRYSLEELLAIYNRARRGYLIPMQMEAPALADYIRLYDLDLTQSLVALNQGIPVGLAMLGLRDDHAWITRVGVNDNQRAAGVGNTLIAGLLSNADRLGIRHNILEVISENLPAQRLFHKFGFQDVRPLLILDRPACPAKNPSGPMPEPLSRSDILTLLASRESPQAWTGGIETYQHLTDLDGMQISDPNLGSVWLAYRHTPEKLTHLTAGGNNPAAYSLIGNLLAHLHTRFPGHSARLENVSPDNPSLPAFQRSGYLESFRRVEMCRIPEAA